MEYQQCSDQAESGERGILAEAWQSPLSRAGEVGCHAVLRVTQQLWAKGTRYSRCHDCRDGQITAQRPLQRVDGHSGEGSVCDDGWAANIAWRPGQCRWADRYSCLFVRLELGRRCHWWLHFIFNSTNQSKVRLRPASICTAALPADLDINTEGQWGGTLPWHTRTDACPSTSVPSPPSPQFGPGPERVQPARSALSRAGARWFSWFTCLGNVAFYRHRERDHGTA
jgi:hypothetical protein